MTGRQGTREPPNRTQSTPTKVVVSTQQSGPGALRSFVGEPAKAWHPHMSTHDSTDATYGVTDDERLRLLRVEELEMRRQEIEQRRRLADAVERLCDIMEAREEATAR